MIHTSSLVCDLWTQQSRRIFFSFFQSKRRLLPPVHSDLFLSVTAAQLYCSLDCNLGAVYNSLWRVQQLSHIDPLCIPPDRDPPFAPLTHTAHHSFLIRLRGGRRVAFTAAGPTPPKQEDLFGLITLAPLLPLPLLGQ